MGEEVVLLAEVGPPRLSPLAFPDARSNTIPSLLGRIYYIFLLILACDESGHQPLPFAHRIRCPLIHSILC